LFNSNAINDALLYIPKDNKQELIGNLLLKVDSIITHHQHEQVSASIVYSSKDLKEIS
jgi:hypothetical protein